MSLPEAIRVRISSEAADGVTITPVVSEIMPIDQIAAEVLGISGKNPERVKEIFARGSLVSGASRFRWDPLPLEAGDIARLLGRFPDPDPSRLFDAALCTAVVLLGLQQPLVIEREQGQKRKLFRRESFWDRLMGLATASAEYKTYSYRQRADVYRAEPGPAGLTIIEEASKLLAWSSYEEQIRRGTVNAVEFHVPRPGS
jgi:hypothetical protein